MKIAIYGHDKNELNKMKSFLKKYHSEIGQPAIFQYVKDYFPIKTSTGIAKILFYDLVYVEVFNKKVSFHMKDGTVKESRTTFSDYEPLLLSHEGFIKTHRSYIVNLFYMEELTQNAFFTCHKERIPVSRLLYHDVHNKYLDFLS